MCFDGDFLKVKLRFKNVLCIYFIDQMSATPSEFCSDTTTVLQVMANEPYCKPYMNSAANSTNDVEICMYVKQFKTCSETKLKFSGFDCDSTVFDDDNINKLLKMKYHVRLPTC